MIRREEVGALLHLDARMAVRVLTSFVSDAVATTGTSGVVIGLSGGIDSALSAALAATALGAERVHAFYLPYRTSPEESRLDAEAVAGAFGLDLREIDITQMVDVYFDSHEETADRLRRGNLMARLRMAVLFDQAKKNSSLVLGTSNKTEILLGYSTIFGDNASSVNPLGDLYKRQVRQLSAHLEIPTRVIDKRPSADLWPGQTDEGELGFDYELADEILYLMFDRSLTTDEIVERGYPADVAGKIRDLEQTNRFKRRLMLIARLSGSAINLDREIPRD